MITCWLVCELLSQRGQVEWEMLAGCLWGNVPWEVGNAGFKLRKSQGWLADCSHPYRASS